MIQFLETLQDGKPVLLVSPDNYQLYWTEKDMISLMSLRRTGISFEDIGKSLKRPASAVQTRWSLIERLKKKNPRFSEAVIIEEIQFFIQNEYK